MAPGPRLVLSEEKVRERSGLGPHRDLAELRSLSIPGTYQEKITHLGNSLMRLTVLKSLDLSRNSLVSLEGIQYLISLESLNLYYNCIASLAEVFRLHSLTELQGLDLRLNPVVKNESDYRLFVVHMLPKLRQLASTDIEGSVSSSQKSALSSQKTLDSLPVADKFRKRRVPGGRFQAPSDWECLSCLERASGPCSLEEGPSGQDSSEGRSQSAFPHSEASEAEEQTPRGTGDAGVPSPRPHSVAPPGKRAVLEWALLEALLDLVDRHWSGCKSLHSNQAFLAQARHILSSVQEFAAAQDSSELGNEEISYLALENKSLQNRLAEHQQQYTTTLSEVTSELSNTRREMDTLRQHLDKSLEENSSLKSLLSSMKKEVKSADASAALNLQISGLQASMKRLSGEVLELKQHLEHYDKIQELTQMLQESHSSLVSTNEHLLQELGRVRAQHRAEVEQMHWSFQELKKTTALFPPRSASLGGRQSC
ncbi:centrosomal protein of 72 kDa isoform X4 [Marmota monax]|uniref:centrosomal protein of 72 kDa isoform X4 n=1 Tax=Marmota monax TaxID=9995 RepID=UPI001EB03F45|nr:centrosomal protein of 72 kDa isoform X4 [Marmota monax]